MNAQQKFSEMVCGLNALAKWCQEHNADEHALAREFGIVRGKGPCDMPVTASAFKMFMGRVLTNQALQSMCLAAKGRGLCVRADQEWLMLSDQELLERMSAELNISIPSSLEESTTH